MGMAIGVITSLLLPVTTDGLALAAIYGLAGVGVAAFTPSALSIVGDTAAPGRIGHAYAWYSTAHYGAIAIGPYLGGLAAERWGHRGAFVASALGIAATLLVAVVVPMRLPPRTSRTDRARLADVRADPRVWAGWIASVSGLFIQGVVFTFFPLLAERRGLGVAGVGLVFLILGAANTVARLPAGWLVDRGGRWRASCAVSGVVVGSLATALVPHAGSGALLLTLVAVFGAASGFAFVAISAGLASAATSATRGVVMGGYSTSLYLGLALGSFAMGPVITRLGYEVGFLSGGAVGVAGTLVASLLWLRARAAGSPQPVSVKRAR
jgi:predicted MFS family arabinose efflux permease